MITIFSSILKYRAFAHPHRIAYTFEGAAFTYEQYYSAALHTATFLKSLGLNKRDRIGILELNTPAAVNLISGAMLLGIIPVSLNWRSMPQEVAFVIKDAGIRHFFYGPAFAQLAQAPGFTGMQLHPVDEPGKAGETPPKDFATDIHPDDVCVILYTSGTTGDPKGVMLTYSNVYSCYQLCEMDTPSFGPDARNLVCGPLFSIFGFGAFFSCIYAGATNVLVRMFEPNMVARIMAETKVTNALLVPIMIKLICSLEGIENFDFSSLKHVQYGGSPISPDTLAKAAKIFGCFFTQVYGLTESSGVACSLRYDDHVKVLAAGNIQNEKLLLSAGKPSLGVEVKIFDEDSKELEVNDPGEVWIRGDNVAKGYWNQQGATQKMFNEDGWLKTGDIGYLDDEGYLFLVDRKNDMIVSKGVNIFPAEIEKILGQHPAIREVAVIGIPDEKAGEAICAVAVLKEGELELSELQQWCKGKVADHKIPKRLELRNELPRNPTGKILRRLIREPFWQYEERRIKG